MHQQQPSKGCSADVSFQCPAGCLETKQKDIRLSTNESELIIIDL
jgi:hypothetical protein